MEKKSLKYKDILRVGHTDYCFFSIKKAAKLLGADFSKLPFSLKVVLENLLRHEDGTSVTENDIAALKTWIENRKNSHEISYRPARVLMQDFTGVPAVVDLAVMRDAVKDLNGNPEDINPLAPVDLVIDHSVQVDAYGSNNAFDKNVSLEMQRNNERYEFLKWGQQAFDNFRVVPPGTGICHQVNVEHLAKVVFSKENDEMPTLFPDTLVGTDSHTTMVNGLAVLGWGVGGIEAEAAMLGQPISMILPEVIGFKLRGHPVEGVTATDVVLTVTQMLREKGVVGKFVEFFGDGLDQLSLADRATIANMAPEYGATCGFFPIDDETIRYLKLTGRNEEHVNLVETYAKAQGMWREFGDDEPIFTDTISLDLSHVKPSIAGPKRPQDKIFVSDAHSAYFDELKASGSDRKDSRKAVSGKDFDLGHGDVVIAAITSCTNTSNPSVMLAAGLVARKARELGVNVKPWVKTSLAPGSKVVSEYLEVSGLQDDLDALGFHTVGYGCTTCIGNSGPLHEDIEKTIKEHNIHVTSVLSGNRNFEGRVHPLTKANYLASPPLVVAYAIAGNMGIDLTEDAIAKNDQGKDIYLADIWPSNDEITAVIEASVTPDIFIKRYADVFSGTEEWKDIKTSTGKTYEWKASSYIKKPPYFEGMSKDAGDIHPIQGAKILALLGDSITTDHISPAGAIAKDSPAAKYLSEQGVEQQDFNSYGSRRGNDAIMVRGTFANIRIRNEMAPGTEGGYTTHYPSKDVLAIYDAAMRYKEENTPLVVIAGKEYGTGSSRDWAAKGTNLLGVKAVITESFERIHRSNLVGMGVLPLTFKAGTNRKTLNLKGDETITLAGIANNIKPGQDVSCLIQYADGESQEISLTCRLDTINEVAYYKNGGILHHVVRQLC